MDGLGWVERYRNGELGLKRCEWYGLGEFFGILRFAQDDSKI
jgi:hypothetical protein